MTRRLASLLLGLAALIAAGVVRAEGSASPAAGLSGQAFAWFGRLGTAALAPLSGGPFTVTGAIETVTDSTLSGGGFDLTGGPAWLPIQPAGSAAAVHRVYLPHVSWELCNPLLAESEPNNYLSEANVLACAQTALKGKHDGASGTGDVFRIQLSAGQALNASLTTQDTRGVQLVLFELSQGEIYLRRHASGSPFTISYASPADGQFFLYLYSDPANANTAAYSLQVQVAGP